MRKKVGGRLRPPVVGCGRSQVGAVATRRVTGDDAMHFDHRETGILLAS